MNPITPGLRPLFNKSKQPAKVQIVVQPGDELAVSDDVAGQLGAEFAPVGDTSKEDAAAARAAAAGEAEAAPVGETGTEVVEFDEPVTVEPVKPKRARKS